MDVSFSLPALNTVLLAILTIVVSLGAKSLGNIWRELRQLNSRVTVLEEFRKSHENWDQERADRNELQHGEINVRAEMIRGSLHTLRDEVFALILKNKRLSGEKE